jgi:AcrR family transcriptional regulator
MSAPKPKPAKPRRSPQQERGERRVEEILDAAAAVFAEVGVDAATTNAIAERAGSAVGSLYHFFPNKAAIVRALAARYESELREVSRVSMPAAARELSPSLMADAIIDPVVGFMERHPAYVPVFYATGDPRNPSSLSVELHRAIVEMVEQLIATRRPSLPADQRHLKATFAVQLVHRMLEYAWTAPPATRGGIIRELKRALALYAEGMEAGGMG